MPLNPETYIWAYNIFQNDKNKYRIRMPGIAESTSVPFKVLYLPFYRSVSEKLEMGETARMAL